MDARKPLVGDKAGGVDDDFAGIKLGLQNVGKDFT